MTNVTTDTTNRKNINKNNSKVYDSINNLKKEKPPPINIYNQRPDDTIKLLTKNDIKDFTIQRINDNKHRVFLQTVESFKKSKDLLNQVAAPYFSYMLKSEKPKTMLLKGLSNSESPEFLREQLKEFESEHLKIIKVHQFTTNHSKKKNTLLPIYLVQVTTNSHLSKLTDIKYLNYQRISWEKITNNDVIVQCKNCQRFGHTASNCHLQYRCVKCNLEHEPGKCEMIVKSTEPYCTNCKKTGHPASYRGCNVYQQLIRKIRENKEIKRNNTKIHSNDDVYQSYIQPNVSFKQAFESKHISNTQHPAADNIQTQTQHNSITQIQARLEKFEKFMNEATKNMQIIITALDSLMQNSQNK